MIGSENDTSSKSDRVAAGQRMADQDVAGRQRVMGLCAEATAAELDAVLVVLSPLPSICDLRPPEAGLVMVQGRAGGDGAPFNLGEATVARATVQVGDALTGFAWHLGRDLARARAAAVIDALWQDEARRAAVEAALTPVAARVAEARAQRASETAATRVNFFTMVRGDD